MANRALILLEGHRSNGPLYIQAAQRLDLHPITLTTDPTQYHYLEREKIDAIRVDTNSLDSLICVCSRLRTTYDIVGITGFSGRDESLYLTVAKLCQHFGLPGPNPAAVERSCDKFVQRQCLAKAGVPMPAFRLAADPMGVKDSATEIGFPVVVKPAVGSGSSGVRLCRDVSELTEHTNYLLGGKHTWPCEPRILVEQFARGPSYSADTMGDMVIAVGAAEFDQPPYFVVRESVFPARLTGDDYRRIVDVSLNCLQALGLSWGPTNIEFRWTKQGPVVIEVNPRLPGWTTPRLIQLAYGVDLITEHINLVTGEKCDLRATHLLTAAARFLVPDRDGILDWIDGDIRAAAVPGVDEVRFYVKPNTLVVRKGDYLDSIGHVIAASPSFAQTEAILDRAVDLIRWSINGCVAV
ncbi:MULTISPECIES: ATP-grasp domain-containing protein [Rhizobium]|uniref:ATP-grasp domain-containing protein n=1 Tax=Rhizobium favelukesii TaxID=348824 RepID=W6RH89_9HYPH|nr:MULTISPECIES: acetyl-CoA carboxylase biotin carboxylase subunit family protein [Rhizobium]MCS0462794.1 acetyl-CoA carboxylase biotin carboxylase subunit family protein [Rhizobium favelukesii]UFS84971.1 acetyl-CoA carboxylase biotin carboxylase subunit family protein [Rhizobium sp. T136]CDM60174.1 putative protein y4rH [Rhizobium favelukesii]